MSSIQAVLIQVAARKYVMEQLVADTGFLYQIWAYLVYTDDQFGVISAKGMVVDIEKSTYIL